MIWSGLVMFLFILIHVKQFKFGTLYETGGELPIRDLYRTEFEVFSQPGWVALYVVCHAARRPAPAPRHLERLPVARPRSSGLHAAADTLGHRPRGRSSAAGSPSSRSGCI